MPYCLNIKSDAMLLPLQLTDLHNVWQKLSFPGRTIKSPLKIMILDKSAAIEAKAIPAFCRLQSCSYGWFYGVTGAYWYSVNDSAIVCLFAGGLLHTFSLSLFI